MSNSQVASRATMFWRWTFWKYIFQYFNVRSVTAHAHFGQTADCRHLTEWLANACTFSPFTNEIDVWTFNETGCGFREMISVGESTDVCRRRGLDNKACSQCAGFINAPLSMEKHWCGAASNEYFTTNDSWNTSAEKMQFAEIIFLFFFSLFFEFQQKKQTNAKTVNVHPMRISSRPVLIVQFWAAIVRSVSGDNCVVQLASSLERVRWRILTSD